jgi:hypothetical protein
MDKQMYSPAHKAIWFAVLVAILLPACEKDKEEEPPLLPPASSMVIDLSDFQQNTKSELTTWNWGNATLNVLVWSTAITFTLAVPVAAFWESFNHEGVYQGDKEWVWSYNVTLLGVIYKADLHGTLQDTSVLWEMYITKTDDYADFLWYYGEVNLDRTQGYWIMNENPQEPNELLRIDWTREANEETSAIKYTNVKPGGDENGGYIQYGKLSEGDYNCFYDVYIKSSNKLVNIQYNPETKEGRIKDPVTYGDDSWHCWDSTLQDTDCD